MNLLRPGSKEVQASVPVQAALGVHISDSDPQKDLGLG